MLIRQRYIGSQVELLDQKIVDRRQRLMACDDASHGPDSDRLCGRCDETYDEIASYLGQQVILLKESQMWEATEGVVHRLRVLLDVAGFNGRVLHREIPFAEEIDLRIVCGFEHEGSPCAWERTASPAGAADTMMQLVFEAQEHGESHYPPALRRKPRRVPNGAL